MKPLATYRIILSLLCGVFLLGLCASACDQTYGGISTSPSDPVDTLSAPIEAPPSCGIWIRDTADLADSASLAGEPPDVVAFATNHATCIDAVTIAQERYPGRSFVRRVRLAFRAYEAP